MIAGLIPVQTIISIKYIIEFNIYSVFLHNKNLEEFYALLFFFGGRKVSRMFPDIVIFCIGFFAALILSAIFKEDNSVSNVQLQEYYCAKLRAKFYKEKYEDLRFILENLNESDVALCDNEHYNHFIIKKKHLSEDFLNHLFDK